MLDVAGEQGYAATTVGDVLARARMSRRTFYSVFENREECFLAAYDETRRRALARVEPLHADRSAALLERALTELLTVAASSPALARVLLVEPASAGPLAVERYERAMQAFARRLGRTLKGGAVSPLRLEAAVGAVARVVQARIVDGRSAELPQLAGELAEMLRDLANVAPAPGGAP
jgi:AcrR family transcriptional regulator